MSDDSPFPAQLASRFRLLGSLGQGGMGTVYRALDLTAQREVAIKVILGDGNATRMARFEREGALTASLNHPNIVRIHDSGLAGQAPYLVYELIPGARTFSEVAHLLELPRAVELLRDAARALGFAHGHGIVHRDVKGENLLIDPAGRIKVADFGIAYAADMERLTQTGVFLGTPSIMAPEQMKPKPTPVPQTDVWALGVLLYQQLCGRLPFETGSLPELIAGVLGDDPPPPSSSSKDVPEALEAICLRCLQKDPAARYANGDALADDLQRVLDGEQPQALVAARAPLPVGPLALAAIVLALGALVLTLGLVHALRADPKSLAPADPAPEETAEAPPAGGARETRRPRPKPLWLSPERVLDHHELSKSPFARGRAAGEFFAEGILTYGHGVGLWSPDGEPVRGLGRAHLLGIAHLGRGFLGNDERGGLWTLPALSSGAPAGELEAVPLSWELHHEVPLKAFPDGASFLVCSPEGELQRVDRASLRVLRRFPAEHTLGFAISPEGERLFVATRPSAEDTTGAPGIMARSRFLLFDAQSGELLREGPVPGRTRCLAFAPDGAWLVAGNSLGQLTTYTREGEDDRPFVADPTAATVAAAHPLGSLRAAVFDPRGEHLYSVALSPDGSQDDLRVWKLPERRLERTIRLAKPGPWHLGISPDGARLAIGFSDGNVEVWATR